MGAHKAQRKWHQSHNRHPGPVCPEGWSAGGAVSLCVLTSLATRQNHLDAGVILVGLSSWRIRSPDTAEKDIYGAEFLLRNVGPANRLVSLPLAVGELSNACLAKFDLGVGDEAANKENPINLCVKCRVVRPSTRPCLWRLGRDRVGRVWGELPSGVGVTV